MRFDPTIKPIGAPGCWTAIPHVHPWREELIICGYSRCQEDLKCRGCVKNPGTADAIREYTKWAEKDPVERTAESWASRWGIV